MSVPPLFWRGLSSLRVDRLLEPATRRPGWTILWGHGVCAQSSRWHASDPRHIPLPVFEQQMLWFLSCGYEFITLEEGLRLSQKGDPVDRKVTLTFDDGFQNVVQFAYPLMQKLSLKGCVFAVAGLLDTGQLLWTDMIDVVCRWHQGRSLDLQFPDGSVRLNLDTERAVTRAIAFIKRSIRSLPDEARQEYFQQVEVLFARVDPGFVPVDFRLAGSRELRGLDPSILEVGNHSMSHPQLARIHDAQVLRREIGGAKERLESLLGRPVRHFCYPSGSYSLETIAEVRRAGHVSGLTVKNGVNGPETPPFELERLSLASNFAQFKCRVSGLESQLSTLKRSLLPQGNGAARSGPLRRRLVVFSHKPSWRSSDSPSGFATDGGFPFQMRALSELFDSTVLLVPCLPGNPGSAESPLVGHHLSVAPLTYPAGTRLGRKLAFPFWLLRNLRLLVRQFRQADAVHAPIPGDIGTVGIILALLMGKPLFVRHCGNWLRPKTAAENFWKWLMQRFAGGNNIMLATGGGSSPPSPKNPRVKWIFSTSLRRDQIADLGSPRPYPGNRPVRLVLAARQDRLKGTELVIEALPLIHAQFPGVVFEVLGDGRDLPSFRQAAADLGVAGFVHFHGYVNHDRVLQIMKQADLFCFPTMASEGFPKVVLEAMACGLPVVTTAVSVLPQLVSGGCGVILAAATPEAVAKAVCSILDSPQEYEAMSRHAVERAQQYSLEAWRDQIGAMLAEAWGRLKTDVRTADSIVSDCPVRSARPTITHASGDVAPSE